MQDLNKSTGSARILCACVSKLTIGGGPPNGGSKTLHALPWTRSNPQRLSSTLDGDDRDTGDHTTTWHHDALETKVSQRGRPLSHIKIWGTSSSKVCGDPFGVPKTIQETLRFGSQGAAHHSTHSVTSPDQRTPRCQSSSCQAIISHCDDVTSL